MYRPAMRGRTRERESVCERATRKEMRIMDEWMRKLLSNAFAEWIVIVICLVDDRFFRGNRLNEFYLGISKIFGVLRLACRKKTRKLKIISED